MIETLQDFHFLRPIWLLAVIPFVMSYLALRRLSSLSGAWSQLIEPRLLKHLVVNQAQNRWFRPANQMLPFGIIAAIAMAGPTWELADSPMGPGESTLLIAIEASDTMNGVDVGPSRLERVKFKVQDLLDAKQAQRTGLFVYGGSAHVVMPPTTDSDVLLPYLEALNAKLIPTQGDNLAALVPELRRLGAGAIKGPTTLVIATDGTNPESAPIVGEWAKEHEVRVVVWAVGTSGGVPGQNVPGLDSQSLKAVANAADGDVVDLTLGSSDIRQILRIVSSKRRASTDPSDDALWKDFGYFLVFPLLFWFLIWFRRGWVVRVGAISMVFFLSGCDASTTFADIWMTPDMQGRYAFEKGDYALAAQRFEDPMWRGVSAYTAGDWEGAIQAFSRVTTAEGYFNLGNAYGQDGKFITAIAMYDKALQKNPTLTQARINRDIFQKDLDRMRESNERVEKGEPLKNSDEEAVELREDQRSTKEQPKTPFDQVRPKDAEVSDLSSDQDDAWMRRVTTNPEDFLRSKFLAAPQVEP